MTEQGTIQSSCAGSQNDSLVDVIGVVHQSRMRDLAKHIVDHYERHALAWDGDRQNSPWNDRRWHDRFIELLPKRATVLDLGCGGGGTPYLL